jgi:hypothetical protein
MASGRSIDASEAMAWTASEDGKQFIARSSEAWGTASVVAGTDQAAAQAAADRTTAFYTPPST